MQKAKLVVGFETNVEERCNLVEGFVRVKRGEEDDDGDGGGGDEGFGYENEVAAVAAAEMEAIVGGVTEEEEEEEDRIVGKQKGYMFVAKTQIEI